MPRYKIYLNNGTTRTRTARTPLQAQHKYYSSNDHFRTEAGVDKVRKINSRGRRKVRRQVGFNPMSMLRRL